MKTIELEIIKKNRVYFACKNEGGYSVKLKITEKSKDLDLGKHTLLVNDISVRTKYGTDLIYELEGQVDTTEFCTLKHRYNAWLVEECRNLGGKWDSENSCWIFPNIVEDKVEELEFIYNTDFVNIEITTLDEVETHTDSVTFLGYPLAKATGRDSGSKICEDVSMLTGKLSSTGSFVNWYTTISKNSVFRLTISKNLLEKYEDNNFSVKII